jgi:hypothetical protein
VTPVQQSPPKAATPAKHRERGLTYVNFARMDPKALANMRARVAQCRRLADSITDARAASILRQMADEGDADIARLEAEAARAAPNPPQPG